MKTMSQLATQQEYLIPYSVCAVNIKFYLVIFQERPKTTFFIPNQFHIWGQAMKKITFRNAQLCSRAYSFFHFVWFFFCKDILNEMWVTG